MKARKALGFSQAQLACEISETVLSGIRNPISQQAISDMENGVNPVAKYVEKYFKEYVDRRTV